LPANRLCSSQALFAGKPAPTGGLFNVSALLFWFAGEPAPTGGLFGMGALRGLRHNQCRKWRMPVNTMAMPCSLAAAMVSSSRIDPPG